MGKESAHFVIETVDGRWFIISSLCTRHDTQIFTVESYTGRLCYTGQPGVDLFGSPREALHSISQGKKIVKSVLKCQAIIGMLVIGQMANLVVVTKARPSMVLPPHHRVYTIEQTRWIRIQLGYPYGQPRAEIKNLDLLSEFQIDGLHFYCETIDLTRPFPASATTTDDSGGDPSNTTSPGGSSSPNLPPPQKYDREFCWNEYFTEPFRRIGMGDWCCVLIQGIAISKAIPCRESPNGLNVCLITRKSCFNPGTRYYARGLGANDHSPGNEIECEHIVWMEDAGVVQFSTHVWRRGTVPIHWRSELNSAVSVTDAEIIISSKPYKHVDQYYRRLLRRYGNNAPLVIVSLLRFKTHPGEALLSDHFQESITIVRKLLNVDISMVQYDWLNHYKQAGLDKAVENLWGVLKKKLSEIGVSSGIMRIERNHMREFRFTQRQQGVLRYNCADSLDRTNLATFFAAFQIIPEMCRSIGVLSPIFNALKAPRATDSPAVPGGNGPSSEPWPVQDYNLETLRKSFDEQLLAVLAEMYVLNGDVCSMLYTNSPAMHTTVIREFAPVGSTLKNAPLNAQILVQRRLQNVLQDKHRQAQYEMFIGLDRVKYFPNHYQMSTQRATKFLSSYPAFIIKSVPSEIGLQTKEELHFLKSSVPYCWICPRDHDFIEFYVYLPNYCRVTEIAITVRHGENLEFSPARMDVFVGTHLDDCIPGFQGLQIPRCEDGTKLWYLLPAQISGIRDRHPNLYEFEGRVASRSMRIVHITFHGVPPGAFMTLGQIQIFGILPDALSGSSEETRNDNNAKALTQRLNQMKSSSANTFAPSTKAMADEMKSQLIGTVSFLDHDDSNGAVKAMSAPEPPAETDVDDVVATAAVAPNDGDVSDNITGPLLDFSDIEADQLDSSADNDYQRELLANQNEQILQLMKNTALAPNEPTEPNSIAELLTEELATDITTSTISTEDVAMGDAYASTPQPPYIPQADSSSSSSSSLLSNENQSDGSSSSPQNSPQSSPQVCISLPSSSASPASTNATGAVDASLASTNSPATLLPVTATSANVNIHDAKQDYVRSVHTRLGYLQALRSARKSQPVDHRNSVPSNQASSPAKSFLFGLGLGTSSPSSGMSNSPPPSSSFLKNPGVQDSRSSAGSIALLSFTDTLEMDLVRLRLGLSPQQRDSALAEAGFKASDFNPNNFVWRRDVRFETAMRKRQKAQRCHKCDVSLKLRKFSCCYCRQTFCKQCISDKKRPIIEFMWDVPQVVCIGCDNEIEKQIVLLNEIRSLTETLEHHRSTEMESESSHENFFIRYSDMLAHTGPLRRVVQTHTHGLTREYTGNDIELGIFPDAGVLSTVATDVASLPVESILLPYRDDFIPDSLAPKPVLDQADALIPPNSVRLWFAPIHVNSADIIITLPCYASLSKLVLISDHWGYHGYDLPSITVGIGERLPRFDSIGEWQLAERPSNLDELCLAPEQQVEFCFPKRNARFCRLLSLKLSLPKEYPSSCDISTPSQLESYLNARRLHIGRIQIFGTCETPQESNFALSQNSRAIHDDIMRVPRTTEHIVLREIWSKFNKEGLILDIGIASPEFGLQQSGQPSQTSEHTYVSGFKYEVRHGGEGVLSQVKEIRVALLGVNLKTNEVVSHVPVGDFLVPKVAPSTVLSFEFGQTYERVQLARFEFLGNYGGVETIVGKITLFIKRN